MEFLPILGTAIIAFIPATIAHLKGRSFGKWWIYSFFLFILAIIHSILIKKHDTESNKKIDHIFKILIYIFLIFGLVVMLWTVIVIGLKITGIEIKKNKNISSDIDIWSEYEGARPQFSIFTLIGLIDTQTKDGKHYVVVDMLIEYDLNDNTAQAELTEKVDQLRDFIKNYFASKYYSDLTPDNEDRLKQEIRSIMNNRYLDTAEIKGILFNKLDVMEL